MSYSKIIINEKWQLNSKIGEGSFGIIFSAHNVKNKEELVAIKLENIDYNKRLLQVEISALKRLQRSRYVPRFFESGSEQNFNFLVMELLGSNLTDIKKQQPDKKFGLNIGCKICIELIHSIQSVHELRYIHRDIKPSNICLNSKGEGKLSDFGMSTELKDSLSKAKSVCGTQNYMSPERILGDAYNFKSDIWGLGITLYQAATGTFPYPKTQNFFEQMTNIVNGDAPCLPNEDEKFSKEFQDFVQQCLTKDPNKRPDATELKKT